MTKQKTVEKPGWRQLGHFSVSSLKQSLLGWRLQILSGGAVVLLLTTTGWAQTQSQLLTTPLPADGARAGNTQPVAPVADQPKLLTSSGYRLHQGDKVEIRFFYQPELNQETLIKPDGTVTVQLIDDVRAEGITVPELEKQLTEKFSKVLLDPLISVILKEYVKPRVFIGGYVTKPGPYELRDGEMLAQVLLLAGGFAPGAHRKQVIHFRPMGEGELRATIIDTTRLFSRNPDPDLNLTLKEGDLIYVPESKMSRLSNTLRALQIQTFGMYVNPFNTN